MEKIKFGFIIIAFEKNFEIIVDENSGQKYIMSGHDYYDADSICSGLTVMYNENGKPDRLTKEQIEYLKSIAVDLSLEADRADYDYIRWKKKKTTVAYYHKEF